MLRDSDFNDIIYMIIYIIFGVNNIFFGINLHIFTKEQLNNAYLDVLGCPRVSWGIKTDRLFTGLGNLGNSRSKLSLKCATTLEFGRLLTEVVILQLPCGSER